MTQKCIHGNCQEQIKEICQMARHQEKMIKFIISYQTYLWRSNTIIVGFILKMRLILILYFI